MKFSRNHKELMVSWGKCQALSWNIFIHEIILASGLL